MPNFNPADYIDVNDRILRFWGEHPDGRIETDLMSPPDDFTQCRYVARIYKHLEDLAPAATGWAFELAGGGGANRTSHEENCETSAIGRALANMGYATSAKDRPSRQEMAKVERGTQAPQPNGGKVTHMRPTAQAAAQKETETAEGLANPGQVNAIESLWQRIGVQEQTLSQFLADQFGVEDVAKLTHEQAGEAIVSLENERRARLPQRA